MFQPHWKWLAVTLIMAFAAPAVAQQEQVNTTSQPPVQTASSRSQDPLWLGAKLRSNFPLSTRE